MKAKNSLLAVGAFTALAGATFMGANTVSAQTSGTSLVSRIAETLNVDEADVQDIFDEHREDRQLQRQAAADEHLQGLVDDGTLNEDQQTYLEEFHAERIAQRQELRDQDLSRDEIKVIMEDSRAELKAWAEEQGLNLDDIRPENGRRGHRHHRFNTSHEASDGVEDAGA